MVFLSKLEINNLNNSISNFKKENLSQKRKIEQFNIDNEELEFLRLNLDYGHKCRKSFFNKKGFSTKSSKYKQCVMNKGRIN